MKKLNQIFKLPLGIICSILVMVAPVVVAQSDCVFLWGEPDCPECLK